MKDELHHIAVRTEIEMKYGMVFVMLMAFWPLVLSAAQKGSEISPSDAAREMRLREKGRMNIEKFLAAADVVVKDKKMGLIVDALSDTNLVRELSTSDTGKMPSNGLERLFRRIAAIDSSSAELLLVDSLKSSAAFGDVGTGKNIAANRVRIKSLGYVSEPSSRTVEFLGSMVHKEHPVGGAAIRALSMYRDTKSKTILEKEIDSRFKKKGDYGILLDLQFVRNRVNAFQLLSNGYLKYRRKEIIDAITSEMPVGLPPSPLPPLPRYDAVAAADAAALIASLDKLLSESDSDQVIADRKATLEEIRKTLKSLQQDDN